MDAVFGILFEIFVEPVLMPLGTRIKKLFGKPKSESGTSEMWIGTLTFFTVILVIAITVT